MSNHFQPNCSVLRGPADTVSENQPVDLSYTQGFWQLVISLLLPAAPSLFRSRSIASQYSVRALMFSLLLWLISLELDRQANFDKGSFLPLTLSAVALAGCFPDDDNFTSVFTDEDNFASVFLCLPGLYFCGRTKGQGQQKELLALPLRISWYIDEQPGRYLFLDQAEPPQAKLDVFMRPTRLSLLSLTASYISSLTSASVNLLPSNDLFLPGWPFSSAKTEVMTSEEGSCILMSIYPLNVSIEQNINLSLQRQSMEKHWLRKLRDCLQQR